MGEFKKPSEQQNKTATQVKAPEEVSGLGEMEYMDTRSSTAQLISLQAAADGRGNRSTTTQLQSKAWNYAGNSRIAQLQTLGEARTTASKTAPIQRAENKTGLPDGLKSGMESISGLSLGDVKVHRNSDKPAQLQAHAYAQGTDIHLGPGQEKHLPHELGHVVQQKQGRVKPTLQLKGKVNVNDDPGLEKEADGLGMKALQAKFITPASPAKQVPTSPLSQAFQFAKSDAEKQWDLKGDNGKAKGASADSPKFIITEGGVDKFLIEVANYLTAINAIDFSDIKKQKQNQESILRLKAAGSLLTTAAVGIGVAATVAAFFSNPVSAVALLASGIAVGVSKAAVKVASESKEEGGKEVASSAAASGVEIGLEALSGAAAGAATGGGALLGLAQGFSEGKEITALLKNRTQASQELQNLVIQLGALKSHLGSRVFMEAITPADMEKVGAASQHIDRALAKVSEIDKNIKGSTDRIEKNQTFDVHL